MSSPQQPKKNLLVGLGNPGKEYNKTRHNVGFLFVDFVLDQLERHSVAAEQVRNDKLSNLYLHRPSNLLLLKPLTYMNNSGQSVASVSSYYKLETENMYVAYDDLDIKLGAYKVSHAKSPKVHNGINSITRSMDTKDYTHLRIGVDNRPQGRARAQGMAYVLAKFTRSEEETISHVFGELLDQLQKMGVVNSAV